MRRFMMVVTLAASACSTIRAGTPLTKRPDGLEWCGGMRRRELQSEQLHLGPGVLPPSMFSHCTSKLYDRLVADEFRGTAYFGLTTNAAGRITSVCLWDADYENGEEYVSCVGKALAASTDALEPNLEKRPYPVTFVAD